MKILTRIFIAISLIMPSFVWAANFPVTLNATSTTQAWASPLNGLTAWTLAAKNFISTSTVSSIFPYASTTALSSLGSAYFATTAGRVGIATTTPGAPLHVQGTGTGSGIVFQTSDSAGIIHTALMDNGNIALYAGYIPQGNVGSAIDFRGTNASAKLPAGRVGLIQAYVGADNSAGLELSDQGGVRMTISSGVGINLIGARSFQPLDVNGSAVFGTYAGVNMTLPSNSIAVSGSVLVASTTGTATLTVSMASTTKAVYVGALGSTTPSLVVDSANNNGNVGIKTAADPTIALKVGGTTQVGQGAGGANAYVNIYGGTQESRLSMINNAVSSGSQFWRFGVGSTNGGSAPNNTWSIQRLADSGASVVETPFWASVNIAGFFPAGGNTGFGATTTPSQTLSVQGNSLVSGTSSTANLTATGTIALNGNKGTTGQVLTSNGSNPASWTSNITPILNATSTAVLLAQNASIASINTFTPTASSTYMVIANTTITAEAVQTLTVNVTYTSTAGISTTKSFFGMGLTTAALSSTGDSNFSPMILRPLINTPVTVSSIVTGVGSITYNIDASIIPVSTQ